jgi:transposase
MGRPGLAPGIYFRLLMVGYFEGIDSERGIAWRASDSLSIRSFVRIALDETVPDHSTISRTRRLMDLETHQAVFQWVLQVLAERNLLKGNTIGWMRRHWKPMQRCVRLCGVTQGNSTTSF